MTDHTSIKKIGILVMSYGTPASMDDIERYYTHIRHGRRPSDAELADLTRRYAAIGGTFPLRDNTAKQVEALRGKLHARYPGRFDVREGLKHAEPFIEDTVRAFHEEGLERLAGIVLAPHYSTMSVETYLTRAREEADKYGMESVFVRSYHDHPLFIQALAERVEDSVKALQADRPGQKIKVLFSAHSLPKRILNENDPYVDELMMTSRLVAEAAGIEDWSFVWQSAGSTREPWLGPDILEVLPSLKDEGYALVLVAPVGFVSEHLEVLYDLDQEALSRGEELGLTVRRTRMLGTDPRFIETLVSKLEEVLGSWLQEEGVSRAL